MNISAYFFLLALIILGGSIKTLTIISLSSFYLNYIFGENKSEKEFLEKRM